MKKRAALFIMMILIVTLALPQTIWADHDNEEHIYQYQTGVLPYSAQMEDETSVRVTWESHTACKGFILSWKKDGSSQKEQSTRIDDPKAVTYVVKDLESGEKYRFQIAGILTGADGKDLLTKPWTIMGTTYLQVPELTNRESMGDFITTKWKLAESYSALKLYRADSEAGNYELIATLGESSAGDSSENNKDDQKSEKTTSVPRREDQHMAVIYKDTDVKPGKTYYYKAQAVGSTGGKQHASKWSSVEPLEAKNFKASFYSKLMNKKGTYTKQFTMRITSDRANYKTYFKKLKSLDSISSTTGWNVKRAFTKVEYSMDGKKFYDLKDQGASIDGGETIYIRVSTKTKFWLRKDGRAELHFDVKYCRPPEGGSVDGADLRFFGLEPRPNWLPGWIAVGDIGGRLVEGDYPLSELDQLMYDSAYLFNWPDSKAEKKSSTSVMLNWKSVAHAESYAVRYGTTKKAATPPGGKPIIVPKYQVQFLIDGLKKGKTYYFSVISCANPDGSDEYDEAYGGIVKWDGKTFTRI